MRAADRRERRFRRVQNQERMTDQYSSYYLQVLLEAASQESVRPIRSIYGTSAKSMGGRVPLMKCGPVRTPGYLAETSGQLQPGGNHKHVHLVAAGRLVAVVEPRRCVLNDRKRDCMGTSFTVRVYKRGRRLLNAT